MKLTANMAALRANLKFAELFRLPLSY